MATARRRGGWVLLLTVATVVVLPARASALPVPLDPAYFYELIGFAGTQATGDSDALPQHLVLSLDVPNVGLFMGFAHTGPGPLPRAEIHYRIDFGSGAASGMADAIIQYQFAVEQIAGAPFGGPVPVILSTAGSASLSLPDWGTAFARLTYPGGQFDACATGSGGCSLPPPSFDETVTIQVPVDTPQAITMRARGVNGVGLPAGGSITLDAFVDPSITIDPAFTLRDQFRIVFSPGLCPDPTCSASVPEPSALFLIGVGVVGLALLGTRARRRGPIERVTWSGRPG